MILDRTARISGAAEWTWGPVGLARRGKHLCQRGENLGPAADRVLARHSHHSEILVKMNLIKLGNYPAPYWSFSMKSHFH